MARKQHRRAISIRTEAYERLRAYAQATDNSMSGILESLLEPILHPEIHGDDQANAAKEQARVQHL